MGGYGADLVAAALHSTIRLPHRLEPLEIGLRTQYDIWMVYHPDSRKIGRIGGATIDWLKTLFYPKTFPWFRDEFIPPERLTGASKDTARPDLFDGFAGR